MQGYFASLGLLTFHWFYPTYDANGNVSEYVDSSENAVAHYEYSPFGQLVASTGINADTFNFRFSTKYAVTADFGLSTSDLGLYYYGHRHYNAETGAWLSRDPIQEQGGLNLYGFVMNDVMNSWDLLGKEKLELFYNMTDSLVFFSTEVLTFSEILEDIKEQVGEKQYGPDGEDPCNCVNSLTILIHGGAGGAVGGSVENDDGISAQDFSTAKLYKKVKERDGALPNNAQNKLDNVEGVLNSFSEMGSYLCGGDVSVEFRSCSAFKGASGEKLKNGLGEAFGTDVTGYENDIIQSCFQSIFWEVEE